MGEIVLKQLRNQIDQNFSFLNGKKLLVACSGGLDSVVLAYSLSALGFDIALAHCNFSLRGKESDGDEMFVIGLAKRMELPVFAETFNTKSFAEKMGTSTQMAARTLRYKWFDKILEDFKYDYLLTGHHLDDDLETFLINFSRGTGISGLTGIPEINGKIIRPLLTFSRQTLQDYAEENRLKWREDSTNKKTDYLRNKLRLDVIPSLKEANISLLENFKKTQKNLKSSKNLIEDYMALIYNLAVSEDEGFYRINIHKIKELPNTEALLYELLSGFGFTQWKDVVALLDAQTGKQLFSKTHRLLRNRDELLLSQIDFDAKEDELLISEKDIAFPIKLKMEKAERLGIIEKNTIYVASEKLKFPVKIRKWREGDRFHPFGMKGKKKLSKFFKDEKISRLQKEQVWLLVSEEKIVWIIGLRMDDRFKVDDDTKEILKISYFEN